MIMDKHLITRFNTKEDLVREYAQDLQQEAIAHYGMQDKEHTDPEIFVRVSKDAARYMPHRYAGGWFIPEYGFSMERITKGLAPAPNYHKIAMFVSNFHSIMKAQSAKT